jgi:hypothetical protein
MLEISNNLLKIRFAQKNAWVLGMFVSLIKSICKTGIKKSSNSSKYFYLTMGVSLF